MANKKKRKIRLFPATRIKGIESRLSNKLKPLLKGMINDVIEYLEPFAKSEKEEERLRKKAFKEAFYEPDVDKIINKSKSDILIAVTTESEKAAKAAAVFTASKLNQPFDERYYNEGVKPLIALRKFRIVTTVITENIARELKTGIRKMITKGVTAKSAIQHFKSLKTNHRTIARTEVLSAANQSGWKELLF